MSRRGNRSGYKCFSINTTIRSARRILDFLVLLDENFNGKIFDKETKNIFYIELLKKGIYRPNNSTKNIMDKYELGQDLSYEEVTYLIEKNEQATGNSGRVMTQLRTLKDLGFLDFKKLGVNNQIQITELGYELLNGYTPDVYTKSLIGLQANSPIRSNMYNQSRPFLNTIFTIRDVNQYQIDIGEKPSGITLYEFGVFILTLKDCTYQNAVNEIIKYRKTYRFSKNRQHLQQYINSLGLLDMKYDNYIREYPDEVFRKFEMTGLLVKNRFNYININTYENEKIKQILEMYDGYRWNQFKTKEEYYDYLYSVVLPWDKTSNLTRVVKDKAKYLELSIDEGWSLQEQAKQLDDQYYSSLFNNTVMQLDLSDIEFEINLLLTGETGSKIKKIKDISDPIKLEWLIAAFLLKNYNEINVKPNLILDNYGYPISHAPGRVADIELVSIDSYGTIEVTMIKNRTQQLNAETTTVTRHLLSKKINNKSIFGVLVAPYIHEDIIRYFKFESKENSIPIIPINFKGFINIVKHNNAFVDLVESINELSSIIQSKSINEVDEFINTK